MNEPKGASTATDKPPRTVDAIETELAKARARFAELEPMNRDYYAKRRRAVDRRKMLEEKAKRETPDHPFDPELYTPPAYVPPEDCPMAREFHRLHYTIRDLEVEFEAAKRGSY